MLTSTYLWSQPDPIDHIPANGRAPGALARVRLGSLASCTKMLTRSAPMPRHMAVVMDAPTPRPALPTCSRQWWAEVRGSGGRRCTRAPLQAKAQQQQQAQGAEELVEMSLEDFRAPKFKPFTPMNAVQRKMTGFRFWRPLPGGEQALLVLPLSAEWVPATADLLTDSFSESMKASSFKNFLRRQIRAYLEAHMQLPPKAVVLVALLLPAEAAAAAAAAAGQGLTSSQQQAVVTSSAFIGGDGGADSSSAGNSMLAGSGATSSTDGNCSSASGSAAAAAMLASDQAQGLPQGQQVQAAVPGCLQSQEAVEVGDGMAMHPLLSSSGSSSDDGNGSTNSSTDEAAAAWAALLQRQQQQQATLAGSPPGPDSGARLAGVVELSFSASTRSQYLTLTPPEDRCYLCNMATHPDLRGRGYGVLVMQAAEQLVASLGEREIYLHLRVQDAPAARLYQKCGFHQVAADSFLIRLLGMDQRRLMRKLLAPAPPTPAAA